MKMSVPYGLERNVICLKSLNILLQDEQAILNDKNALQMRLLNEFNNHRSFARLNLAVNQRNMFGVKFMKYMRRKGLYNMIHPRKDRYNIQNVLRQHG